MRFGRNNETWQPVEIKVEQVLMRAVPCDAHQAYETDCPDCLTGAQAVAAGKTQGEDLGIVAYWHRNPKRLREWRRRNANTGHVTLSKQED